MLGLVLGLSGVYPQKRRNGFGPTIVSFPDAQESGLASFPGSHAQERELVLVHIRVPGEPGNEAKSGRSLSTVWLCSIPIRTPSERNLYPAK